MNFCKYIIVVIGTKISNSVPIVFDFCIQLRVFKAQALVFNRLCVRSTFPDGIVTYSLNLFFARSFHN